MALKTKFRYTKVHYEGWRLFKRVYPQHSMVIIPFSTLCGMYRYQAYLIKCVQYCQDQLRILQKITPFTDVFVVVLDCIGQLPILHMNRNMIEYHTFPLHIYIIQRNVMQMHNCACFSIMENMNGRQIIKKKVDHIYFLFFFSRIVYTTQIRTFEHV